MLTTTPPDRFLSYAQVAKLVGLDIDTLKHGGCGTNEIPRIKLGRRTLFSFNAVQSWMAAKAREAEEAKRRSNIVVIDLVAEKNKRRRAVEKTLTTIINGGRYK